jgi:hypothetical protein
MVKITSAAGELSQQQLDKMGGPAFPLQANNVAFVGMTLRDWFAGQALVGILAGKYPVAEYNPDPETIAKDAYKMADAMLAQRVL